MAATPTRRGGLMITRPALHRILRVATAGGLLAVVIALVGLANESRSDVASQTTLLALLVGSAVLGFVWSRLWWIPALLVGGTVAVEHLVAVWFSIPEPGVHLPVGVWGTITLLILVIPALIAGRAGAGIRHLVSHRPAARAVNARKDPSGGRRRRGSDGGLDHSDYGPEDSRSEKT